MTDTSTTTDNTTPEETLVMVDELPSKRGRKGFWPARLDRIRDNAPRWTNATETWQTKHRQSVIQAIGVTDDKDNFEVALRDGQVFVRYNVQSNATPVVVDQQFVSDEELRPSAWGTEPKTAFDYLNDDDNLL